MTISHLESWTPDSTLSGMPQLWHNKKNAMQISTLKVFLFYQNIKDCK